MRLGCGPQAAAIRAAARCAMLRAACRSSTPLKAERRPTPLKRGGAGWPRPGWRLAGRDKAADDPRQAAIRRAFAAAGREVAACWEETSAAADLKAHRPDLVPVVEATLAALRDPHGPFPSSGMVD